MFHDSPTEKGDKLKEIRKQVLCVKVSKLLMSRLTQI